ncbi:MAG: hypothetical protein HOV66_28690 [Streptomycetaceae bacterium]|nr:hypothetical protein [Streptomycetaceae bacterium]
MSNADLFIEAIDTAIHLGYALAGWMIFFAVVGAILVLAAIATGTYGMRAAWRHTAGPSWHRSALRARIHARRATRASRRRTRPHEFEEAA